jgi:hypothetical protein
MVETAAFLHVTSTIANPVPERNSKIQGINPYNFSLHKLTEIMENIQNLLKVAIYLEK